MTSCPATPEQIAAATDQEWLGELHAKAWREQDGDTQVRALNRLRQLCGDPDPAPQPRRRRRGYIHGHTTW